LRTPAAVRTLASTSADVAGSALFERGTLGVFNNSTGVDVWGPRVLARRINNNTRLPDQYLVDWGGLAPSVLATGGQGRRYFTSLLVHRSWWHFFILALVTMVGGAIMERR